MKKVMVDKQRAGHLEKHTTALPRVLDPVSTTESIVTAALEASAPKMGLSNAEAFIALLKQGDSIAHNYYCYNIIKEMGEVLGSWSKNIKAVYACSYDEAVNGEDSCEKSAMLSLIHVIIWVTQKGKALDALIETIDSALVQRHRQMLGLKQLEHALDARVIDDADVKNRTGYAVLLKSIHQPAIEVWRCAPDI